MKEKNLAWYCSWMPTLSYGDGGCGDEEPPDDGTSLCVSTSQTPSHIYISMLPSFPIEVWYSNLSNLCLSPQIAFATLPSLRHGGIFLWSPAGMFSKLLYSLVSLFNHGYTPIMWNRGRQLFREGGSHTFDSTLTTLVRRFTKIA